MSKEGRFECLFSIKTQMVTRNTENKCPDNSIHIYIYMPIHTHNRERNKTVMRLPLLSLPGY